MFSIDEDSKSVNLIFSDHDISLINNDIIYDRGNIEITSSRLNKLFSIYEKSIFRTKNEYYRINIPFRAIDHFAVLNKRTTQSVYHFCNPIGSLIKPIFLKNTLKDDAKLKKHQIEGVQWLSEKKNKTFS